MEVYFGNGKTEHGTGVQIDLTGEEVARAIYAYLVAHNVHIQGAATIRVNGELCKEGEIYVDPSGFVVANGKKWSGRGMKESIEKYERAFNARLAYEKNCIAKYDYLDNRPSKPPIKGERMKDYAIKYNTTIEEMKACELQVERALANDC
jgi:hypothetical protein